MNAAPRRRALLVATITGATALVALALGGTVAHAQEARREPPPAPTPAPAPVVTKPPALLQAVAPDYPPEALAKGLEASVKVRLHIDDAGIVTKVEVLEPVGNGFDESAVAAAEQYVFSPAEIDGKPAAIAVETQIHFVIEQREEPDELPPTAPTRPGPGAADEPTIPGHAGNLKKPVSISGEAVERGTRRALAGVIVSLVELGLDTVTDDDGRFFFHGVAPGTYHILAVDDRYDRFERPLVLGSREAVDVRLWLRPRGGNPYETVVEGEREVLEVTRRTLQRRQMTSVPGTFGDPIRVLQTLPGVSRAPFGLGLLVVRGSNPDDTGLFIDGHRVPLLFHFAGGPSVLNAEFLESIDLYPGGFPARFGRGHGGVVTIETRPSKSDGVHGSADVDLLDSGAYLRAPITKDVSIAVAGRRSYLDTFLDYVLPEPDPGSTRIIVPVYYDYQGRIDAKVPDGGRVSLTTIGSSDQLKVVSADADEEESLNLNTRIDFFRLIGTYTRPLAGDLTLTLSQAWGRDSITFSGAQAEAAGPFTSFELRETTLSHRTRVAGKLASRLVLDAGIDVESRVTRYEILAPLDDDIRDTGGIDIPPEKLSRTVESLGLAVHADLAIDVTSRLRLIPGLRVDGYVLSTQLRSSVDPRLVARYALSSKWTAKGHTGVFHQPPQPEALDAEFGNPDIGLERGLHFGAGVEWKPTRWWLADLEIYDIERDDLVIFVQDAVRNPDTGEVEPVNFANRSFGRTYGLELMIRREVTDSLYGWLSYTFSHTRVQRSETGRRAPTAFDQPHTMNAVASWRPGGGWEVGARLQVASGLPDTPINGATFDADSGGYEDVRGPIRSQRRPFFNQLDVRIEKTWLFQAWSVGAYIDVQNALFTDNVEAYEYDYRFRARAAITGIPFLPTIGIRGQW